MIFPLVRELAADGFAVAVTCQVLGVSRSGYYDWTTRSPSARSIADAELSATIVEIPTMSRRSYAHHGCTANCGWPVRSAADASGSPD